MTTWDVIIVLFYHVDGLCRKVAFETIGAMVSPDDLRCAERENDDGDQLQGSPFSAGYYADGGAVVCRLSLERPACRRTHAGTRRAGRPRDHAALGGERQSPVGSGVSSPQAVGVAELAQGRDVYQPMNSHRHTVSKELKRSC